jgi:hypothetical protein
VKESKIYTIQHIVFPKNLLLRKITFVCRQKEWYKKQSIAVWWSLSYGLALADKPNKQLKFFMLGFSLFNID